MKYNGIVQRKLTLLDEQVMRLRQHLDGVTAEAFAESWALRSMTERALQVAVEIVIDIAERIIAIEGAGPVPGASAAIDRLVTLGVLPSAEPYRTMVGFRNMIVHQYERVDPALVYELATRRLDDFRQFRDELDRL